MRVHPAAARFDACVDVYERSRPGYPADAVAFVADRLALTAGRVVVDLGAGTGKLTRALVPTGARVVAVEPLGEMRAKLERLVPAADAVEGTAEALPLDDASADGVVVAQAFHWFDVEPALREIHRVLRPGGRLALIWNSRDLDDPLQSRLEETLRPYRGDAPRQLDRRWRADVDASPLFGPGEEATFPWEQPFTAQDLVDRAASMSFVDALPRDEHARLLTAVRALAPNPHEPFPFRYRTDVFVFPSIE